MGYSMSMRRVPLVMSSKMRFVRSFVLATSTTLFHFIYLISDSLDFKLLLLTKNNSRLCIAPEFRWSSDIIRSKHMLNLKQLKIPEFGFLIFCKSYSFGRLWNLKIRPPKWYFEE